MFKFWPRGNRRNRALFTRPKKNKNSPASPTVATAQIAPTICQGQSPTMYSECSRFHRNRFTFGGVIAERMKTAKSPHKINPIFGRSLASSRIHEEGKGIWEQWPMYVEILAIGTQLQLTVDNDGLFSWPWRGVVLQVYWTSWWRPDCYHMTRFQRSHAKLPSIVVTTEWLPTSSRFLTSNCYLSSWRWSTLASSISSTSSARKPVKHRKHFSRVTYTLAFLGLPDVESFETSLTDK